METFLLLLIASAAFLTYVGWPLLVERHARRVKRRQLARLRGRTLAAERAIHGIVQNTHAEMLRILMQRRDGTG